jgi:outer membrane receptor protein involved in Fe transport
MGLRHEFTSTLSGDATFFYKDIYDYPTSVRFTRPGQGPIFIYINNDFARSRGFELTAKKRKSQFLSGSATYSYSVVTGKASDPNQTQILQETEGAFAEIGLEEGYLWWNRPHKFTIGVDYEISADVDAARVPSLFGMQLPRDFAVNSYLQVRSGRAYTPEDELGNETGKKFSENAALSTTVDLSAEKGFRLGGNRHLRVSVECRNIFNSRYPTRVDPSTGEVPTIGQGQVQAFTEPEARDAQFVAYQNPSWWSAPRNMWVGLGVEW